MAINTRMLFTLLFLFQNRTNGCKSVADINTNIDYKELPRLDTTHTQENKLDFSLTKNGADTIKNHGTDLDIKSTKRPNFSNIEQQIKDIFEGSYYESTHRYKRKAPERSLSSLRRRLNEDKKKDELIAAYASPRLEPNYTQRIQDDPHFGGINTEQLYNKKNDKIHLLHLQRNEEKQKDVEPSDTDCNFETDCTWTWRKDIANGFFITSGNKFSENDTGPRTDANSKEYGELLFLFSLYHCPTRRNT
ncbi:hypothetical protein BDFB_007157 [Asbolus verrucosus]|uniref:Uncharacterized protein n=1 Tax=Asbolus verrucosus TaxID=1661398 RepID=A0A482VEK2_ASBVE|nr:hypothetical protein BDFB_007157 [Asbolus verrucosus]